MSRIGPEIDALAANALSSKPRQGRSLASFERMLAATHSLMLERGNDDFTLQDVSQRGNVSIGSIYLRFESKDRLLHAVIAQELQIIIGEEKAMLDRILAESHDLEGFLALYIDRYSALLSEHARFLRTVMQRAAVDPAVSEPGKETARKSAAMSVAALMTFKDEIRGDDPQERIEAVYQIIYATIARQFGLGVTPEQGDEGVWAVMKRQLATMALAYLSFEG